MERTPHPTEPVPLNVAARCLRVPAGPTLDDHADDGPVQTILGKYFAILMRTNALFVGAIAVEMIVSGLQGALSTGSDPATTGG